MSKRPPDIQVLIPYKDLVGLLKASEELPELRKENAEMKEQIFALRQLFVECLDKLHDLEKII